MGEEALVGRVRGEGEVDEPEFADAGPGEDGPCCVTLVGGRVLVVEDMVRWVIGIGLRTVL